MKVNQAEFVISAVGPSQYPGGALPEIALAGRSNVGKSSLINRLINRRNLARTSSKPGKTQQLNYYRINQDLYFVDLPGYGYAKVSKTERAKWGKFIEQYLLKREFLRLVLHVIDLRHPPSKDDIVMHEWLMYHKVPVCLVLTKADKVPRGKWAKHTKIIKEQLQADPAVPVILFSSETGYGKDELWSVIERYAGLAAAADGGQKEAADASGSAAAGDTGEETAADDGGADAPADRHHAANRAPGGARGASAGTEETASADGRAPQQS